MGMKSYLFVPGHHRGASTCRKWGADHILWDLEDGVPEALVEEAEAGIVENWQPGDHIRLRSPEEVGILAHVTGPGLVWIPKVEGASDVPSTGHDLCLLFESPRGILNASELVSRRGVKAIGFGRDDFMSEVGIHVTQSHSVTTAQGLLVILAKANGIECIDSPCTWRSRSVATEDCWESHKAGFDGKMVCYPDHVEIVGIDYDTDYAKEILLHSIEGCVDYGGRMIGPPIVKWARKVTGADS